MSIMEKIANAKEASWVSEGLSEAEIITTVELAKISAKIERARIELGMTQKEFADYMGVTQGMVSKWESREYNFTIRSLNEISYKLGIPLTISMDKKNSKNNYGIIRWESENRRPKKRNNTWINGYNKKEGIA